MQPFQSGKTTLDGPVPRRPFSAVAPIHDGITRDVHRAADKSIVKQ
jgi:hypothetical protein